MTKNNQPTPEQLLAEDTEKSKALAATMNAITTEQLEMNQLLGRIQATHAIGNMLEALSLSQLQAIKQQKAYRQLQGQTQEVNGTLVDLGTWKGFCKAIGASRETIDLRLKDLQLLGETALENAQNLGMTTRELRKLRKLDPNDQSVIINELEASIGDKDAIVELIENMSVKHRQEKEALQAQIKDEKAERQASERMVSQKQKKIDELDKEIIKQETMTVPEKEAKALNVLSRSFNLCRGSILDVGVKIADVLSFATPAAEQSCLGTLLILRNEIDRIFAENDLHGVLMDTSDAEIDEIVDKAMLAINKDDSESE
ncbi:MAG: hypothetical protein CR977_00100 [Gammaproteobacteria bacterium]|nr:MAG: hypothetical protein CR977_00100 [Gammaproteobacteria bacterium]